MSLRFLVASFLLVAPALAVAVLSAQDNSATPVVEVYKSPT